MNKSTLELLSRPGGRPYSLRLTLPIILVVLSAMWSNQTLAESTPFSTKQFTAIEQQNLGKQWLLLLWSLDCPPCFKELAVIAKLKKMRKDLPVVVINTDDDDSMQQERDALIAKYDLQGLTNLHFVDGKAGKNRMAIDKSWYGELPRSYFYQADGKRLGRSGLVAVDKLKMWLL